MQPPVSSARYLVISRDKAHRYAELARLLRGRLDLTVILDRRYGDRRKNEVPVAADRRRPGRDRRQGQVPTSYFGFGRWAEPWAQGADQDASATQPSPSVG